MADQLDIIQKLSVPRYAPRLEPLPIPAPRWNDEPLLCLQVNDEWVSHILGVLTALDQSDTWLGTDDEIFDARQQVNEIMLAFMEECMDCCGPDEIPLSRINEDGVYQQSTDGGVTWVDAPQFDPRNTIPRILANPSPDSDNAKCLYADSVVNHFKEGFIDVIEEGQTVSEVMATITAIVEWVFGPLTGPIGWIVPAIFAIATAVVIGGITLLKGEMTTAVWDGLRCLLDCNMQNDGSFSAENTSAIYAGIDDITADILPRTILKSWIAALGATGLSNAAHLGMGMTGADCEDCSCGPACDPLSWHLGALNSGTYVAPPTVVDVGSDYLTLSSVNRGDGTQSVYITSRADNDCCNFSTDVISGPTPDPVGIACGTSREVTNFVSLGLTPPNNLNALGYLASSPFTVKITFGAIP